MIDVNMKFSSSAKFRITWAALLCSACVAFEPHVQAGILTTSPDGNVVVTVDTSAGNLNYSVSYRGSVVIETSPLGATVNGTNLMSGVTITGSSGYGTNETFVSRHGIHAQGTNNYQGQQISVSHSASGISYVVNVRAY